MHVLSMCEKKKIEKCRGRGDKIASKQRAYGSRWLGKGQDPKGAVRLVSNRRIPREPRMPKPSISNRGPISNVTYSGIKYSEGTMMTGSQK